MPATRVASLTRAAKALSCGCKPSLPTYLNRQSNPRRQPNLRYKPNPRWLSLFSVWGTLSDVQTYDHADERHAARPLAERIAGASAEALPCIIPCITLAPLPPEYNQPHASRS